ncbi:Urease accessory protein UreD [Actinomadura rubteroloni]|uniref:Urease accessory protein UreD n=1 Tax=Actinomadura rubteroloni TaxID=1926885 RepID=A0A2P4UH11_9ACTN|nr:urease accessory protein UreD [Actinomadura rubteroloni]POM24288.1 Urease accessory protein UreD [Actinomadura rubteroloni]
MTRGYAPRAAVTAEADASGRTRLTRLRSDGPLAVRATADAVYLVGAAASPLGGDDLELELAVGPGAALAIRSAATTLALPGAGESRMTVRASVGAGGRLDYAPEPTVAARGCRHRAAAVVELAAGAALRWREELVLGRHGEAPGRHVSRFDVTCDGRPLLRHELVLDDPAVYGSAAVLDGARTVGSVLLVDGGLCREPHAEDGLAVLPLAGPGVLVTATAPDSAVLRRRLRAGEAIARAQTPADAPAASAGTAVRPTEQTSSSVPL